MADIKVLMVLDGERFNFGPRQADVLDPYYFGITALVAALEGSTTPTIQVDKAHRRGHTFNTKTATGEDCSVGLSPMYQGDFVFAQPAMPLPNTVTADLLQYDVLWLIGDEGLNDGGAGSTADSPITDDEKIAIANFMAAGGGVFAVGDHDGIGSDMCGYLPRVRTMRRWFDYHATAGGPIAAGNNQRFVPNWNAFGLASALPAQPDRNDTLQPDITDHFFYFNGQSDAIPQNLLDASGTNLVDSAGPIHPLLRDGNGQVIGVFPDHMHEGEATDFTSVSPAGSPFDPNISPGNPYSLDFHPSTGPTVSFVEFPAPEGFQAEPEVIAYDNDSGHGTYAAGYSGATPEYPSTVAKRRGAISVYDGRASNVGRIVTGSTFHHYLDKNLVGDPQTVETYQTPGHGPTNSDNGLNAAALTAIGDFYVNVVTWLAKPNNNFQFWVLKNTYGANESVVAALGFPDAFYLVLDGFAPSVLGSNPTVNLSGPLAGEGVTFTRGTPVPDNMGAPNTPQRILIPFSVNPIPAGAFPAPGNAPKILTLEARLTVGGQNLAAEAVFELTASPDPFFANVAATNPPNPFYLSQDLRVFQFAPAIQSAPFITFQSGWTGHDYVTQLLTHLNDPANHFTDGTNDPMPALSEPGDLGVASSVRPTSPGMGGTVPNYAFAVARVRFRNTVGATAPDVRVFFRLFTTLSNDTDYDPVVTYPSTLDAANLPARPVAGLLGTTFPMTASTSVAGDYPGPNQQNVSVSAGGESYAFFGCYLDVYSPGSPIPAGGHHCLVAQIAYDQAPIVNSNGITLSPENSDKLAQRNIDFTPSGNPGGPAAHRVPQTFDTRPSTRTAAPAQTPQGYPDELLIDWGDVPHGSRVSIYWPDATAIDVVRLATLLYPSHNLAVADAHTVQCTVSSRLTYVPIPFGSAGKLAGVFTIDLPLGVRRGQVFSVVVRRIGTRRLPQTPVLTAAQVRGKNGLNRDWRYVVGTFQITIPVETEDRLLWPEENVLAIFKWRLQQMAQSDRWYHALQRYLEYVTARVEAFGGNPATIPPSRTGAPPPDHHHRHHHHHERPGCLGMLLRFLRRLFR